jgi:hypothetical protein
MSLFRKAPKPIPTQTNPYLERVKNTDVSRFYQHTQGVEELEIVAPAYVPMVREVVLERPEDHPIAWMIEDALREGAVLELTIEELIKREEVVPLPPLTGPYVPPSIAPMPIKAKFQIQLDEMTDDEVPVLDLIDVVE